jgi:CO/xanthine dehydrogenase Mo-binding subunit
MDGPKNGSLNFSFSENPHRYGPFGAKGIGEVAMVPILPAMANAVSDALGAELHELPFTRERVLKAIRETEKRE